MKVGHHAISSRASYGGATFDDPVTWRAYCQCGWHTDRRRTVEEVDAALGLFDAEELRDFARKLGYNI
jgi:hypothetical protein